MSMSRRSCKATGAFLAPLHLQNAQSATELVYGTDEASTTQSIGQQVIRIFSAWTAKEVDARLLMIACPNLRKWEIQSGSLTAGDIAGIARNRAALAHVHELIICRQELIAIEHFDRLVGCTPRLRRLHLMRPTKAQHALDVPSVSPHAFPNFSALSLEDLRLEGLFGLGVLLLQSSCSTLRTLTLVFSRHYSKGLDEHELLENLIHATSFPNLSHLRVVVNNDHLYELDPARLIAVCPALRSLDVMIESYGDYNRSQLSSILDACPAGLQRLALGFTNTPAVMRKQVASVLQLLESGRVRRLRHLQIASLNVRFARVDSSELQAFCRRRRIRLT